MASNNELVVQGMLDSATDNNAIKDFESARANILSLVETSTEAIKTLGEIAEKSQNPAAYQVLANLIDKSVIANKTLLDLQEQIRVIKQQTGTVLSGAKITNNNLFLGTTAELAKVLQDMRENNEESEEPTEE